MRRTLSLLLLLSLLLALVSCGNHEITTTTAKEDPTPASVTVSFEANFSSYGKIKGSATQILENGAASQWVEAVPYLGFVFVAWSDGVTQARREGEHFYTDTTVTAIFSYPTTELPLFSFVMQGMTEVPSKTEYTQVKLTVSNTDADYCLSQADAQLRGRGNATWRMKKKSYRLKLSQKENLLGQGGGAAKDWVLLANHCDQTLLRNYLAFSLGNALDGIEYATSARFVEVIINGQYKGVYLLCEQVEAQKHRVALEEDGFLVELDHYATQDVGVVEGIDYFFAAGQAYTVKSDADAAQVQQIKNRIAAIDAAIQSGDRARIESAIDLDSCIDMYLIHEFLLNIDVGWSSFYLYQKTQDGKLYFGPVWDFDLAAGNDQRLFNGDAQGLYVGVDTNFTQKNVWFIALMQQDWFVSMVKARWEETKDVFFGLSALAQATAQSMPKAIERNFQKWDIFGQRINQEPNQILALSDYDAHLQHLCTWLERRYVWMDAYFS